jgi:rhodanese-related sulfurtransferase
MRHNEVYRRQLIKEWSPMNNITPSELKVKLTANSDIKLIDCRELEEWEAVRIKHANLIPLSQFEEQSNQIELTDDEIVVHCHSGVRSLRACAYLKSLGHKNVTNLVGGIKLWEEEGLEVLK